MRVLNEANDVSIRIKQRCGLYAAAHVRDVFKKFVSFGLKLGSGRFNIFHASVSHTPVRFIFCIGNWHQSKFVSSHVVSDIK